MGTFFFTWIVRSRPIDRVPRKARSLDAPDGNYTRALEPRLEFAISD